MEQISQLIFDGTFDRDTGALRLYETGQALGSAYCVYDQALRDTRYSTISDNMWQTHLAPRLVDNADQLFRSHGNFNPVFTRRTLGLESFDVSDRTYIWNRIANGQDGLIMHPRLPTRALLDDLKNTTFASMRMLDSFPLLNTCFWDKAAFYTLMNYFGAAHVLPKQKLYVRGTRNQLEPEILNDWGYETDTLLLKTPDAQNGDGVTPYHPLADKTANYELSADMAFFPLTSTAYPVGLQQGTSLTGLRDLKLSGAEPTSHPLILAQEITKGVLIDGYQPTFRAVITVTQDDNDGTVSWELHDAYWKFPNQKAGTAHKRESVLSDNQENGRLLTSAEMSALRAGLERDVMPAIRNIITADTAQVIEDLMDSDDPATQVQAVMLYASEIVSTDDDFRYRKDTWRKACGILKTHRGLEDCMTLRDHNAERVEFTRAYNDLRYG